MSIAKYKPVKLKPYNLQNERLLKKKISDATKAIRKKYLALKLGKAEEDETIHRVLKPIIEPLKDIKVKVSSHNVKKNEMVNVKPKSAKEDILPIEKKEEEERKKMPPVEYLQDDEVFSYDASRERTPPSLPMTYSGAQAEAIYQYDKHIIDEFLEQFAPISRQYIEGLFTRKDDYDENFGARFDFTTNKFQMGNKNLDK